MSNEATVHSSLQVRINDSSGNARIDYRSGMATFKADVSGCKGPVVGALEITVAGVSIDLSELTTPGFARFSNQGDNYRYDVGIWDPDNSKFFPLFTVRPHRSYVLELSPDLAQEYGTGTGTTGAGVNVLRAKAVGGATDGLIEVFEA